MDHTKRGLFAAVMLMISIGNYTRLEGADNVRAVVFLQIFAIGALSAVVIREVLSRFKNKDNEK
jgi:xanthine/uracil permease